MASLGVRSPWSKGTLDVYNYISTVTRTLLELSQILTYLPQYSNVHRSSSDIIFSYEITLHTGILSEFAELLIVPIKCGFTLMAKYFFFLWNAKNFCQKNTSSPAVIIDFFIELFHQYLYVFFSGILTYLKKIYINMYTVKDYRHCIGSVQAFLPIKG